MWTAFNVTQAALIAPMMAFFPPAILARAGLYTVAMMGSIAFVGATAKQDKYLYIGGPLMAGMAVVLASGLKRGSRRHGPTGRLRRVGALGRSGTPPSLGLRVRQPSVALRHTTRRVISSCSMTRQRKVHG